MKENIFYWSPCLNPVGTVKSTINSAISLKKFNIRKILEIKKILTINAGKSLENLLNKKEPKKFKSYFLYLFETDLAITKPEITKNISTPKNPFGK